MKGDYRAAGESFFLFRGGAHKFVLRSAWLCKVVDDRAFSKARIRTYLLLLGLGVCVRLRVSVLGRVVGRTEWLVRKV